LKNIRYSDQKLWFTSDTHFNHKKVVEPRLFSNVHEMNTKLVQNWNSLVQPEDHVFHLGDFCFGKLDDWQNIREQLNGNIHLVRGNHDKFQTGQIDHLFSSINDYLKIQVKDENGNQGWQHIILMHYAFRVWDQSHYGSWHLYGHSHGKLLDNPASLSFDVGVDCHNLFPISYQQVKEIMCKKSQLQSTQL